MCMDGTARVRVPQLMTTVSGDRRFLDSLNAVRVVGVDVGGTFTDFVTIGVDGSVTVSKHPTTPDDPARGVLEGVRALRAAGLLDAEFTLAHGTTVATNAMLERR